MELSAVDYLKSAGFDYKPAESPDIWNHLECRFVMSNRLGARFDQLPALVMGELISRGEDALLDELVASHRKTGALHHVSRIIDLPYVIGTEGRVPLTSANTAKAVCLLAEPGTVDERIVRLLPSGDAPMPGTHHLTVTGGLYADGYTVGYYDLYPGKRMHAEAGKEADAYAYLATADDIRTLVGEMQRHIDKVTLISRSACEKMIKEAIRTYSS